MNERSGANQDEKFRKHSTLLCLDGQQKDVTVLCTACIWDAEALYIFQAPAAHGKLS